MLWGLRERAGSYRDSSSYYLGVCFFLFFALEGLGLTRTTKPRRFGVQGFKVCGSRVKDVGIF